MSMGKMVFWCLFGVGLLFGIYSLGGNAFKNAPITYYGRAR